MAYGDLMSDEIERLKERIARNRVKIATLRCLKSADKTSGPGIDERLGRLERVLAIEIRLLTLITSRR